MNWKTTIISLLLVAALFTVPALAAENFGPQEKAGPHDKDKPTPPTPPTPKPTKPIGAHEKIKVHEDVKIVDAKEKVHKLKNDKTKTPQQKLNEYPELFGYDEKLEYYLYEMELQTEEAMQVEEENPVMAFFGDVVETVTDFFTGKKKPEKPEAPYTAEEGEAAWASYMASYIDNYQPTGEFGGPIQ